MCGLCGNQINCAALPDDPSFCQFLPLSSCSDEQTNVLCNKKCTCWDSYFERVFYDLNK